MSHTIPIFLKSFSSVITSEDILKVVEGLSVKFDQTLPSVAGEHVRVDCNSIEDALRVGVAAYQTIQDCSAATSEADMPPISGLCFSRLEVDSSKLIVGNAKELLPRLESCLDSSVKIIICRENFEEHYKSMFEIYKNRVVSMKDKHSDFRDGPYFLPITTENLPYREGYATFEEANEDIRVLFREYMYNFFNMFFVENNVSTELLLSEDFELVKMSIDDWSRFFLMRSYNYLNGNNVYGEPYLADLCTSVHVDGEKINFGRFSTGSVCASPKMIDLMRSICKQRSVPFLDQQYIPGGIGYDLAKGILKIYYMSTFSKAPANFIATAPKDKIYRDRVLVSYSYSLESGKCKEEKVYVYPIKEWTAILLAGSRGVLNQIDCTPTEEEWQSQKYLDSNSGVKLWLDKVNDTGKSVMMRYQAQGTIFTAIEYENSNKFSLYFPLDC